ncbi:putative spore germination protein gerPF [Anoxybacillus sp. B7M1]|jgi:spore germination protein PF|uniref:Spore germination protein n=1 Tax=Anoxybacteroides rupiense TaxID=311460 RepID=A0ABD5IWN1_9BACL|nr:MULTISPECIES: spore germination protein [Anoxybacillus]ANB56814.1 putative spore germination protein gerPF [Anoxybacillus sp. B2M1]ANB63820.1 putative spore germination protein gerPF [Anoxybacillus sp. B7M1]KXG10109.1 putative spore germination protein GerPF [Anoxybacillus sp. P3H1B]MBB3907561.1 spore germination protein PF [Anoxybacillus rupiensis]MBS2770548.1 spore germination protein [Anoxybacillus rupiensis]
MPSFIGGPIKITHVSGDGTVNFGDVLQIAPKSALKSNQGAGGGNNGDFLQTNTFVSFTNTSDPDVNDANNVANN